MTHTNCGTEAVYDVDPTRATIYGNFIYYFVTLQYKVNPACGTTLYAGSLHVMDLTSGTCRIVVSTEFASGVYGNYLGHIADYGVAITLQSTLGYKIVDTSAVTGTSSNTFIVKDSASYWKFLQARLGADTSRPFFAVSSTRKSDI